MLKIGDFSRITQVTIKTLRYYDRIDLLKPAHVDRFTGHRFYRMSQIVDLNRIIALKDMGVSLEQIRLLLEEDLSMEALQGIFRLKQAELQATIEQEQAKLNQVKARIAFIQKESKMPEYEVTTKKLEAQYVLSMRQETDDVGSLFAELSAALELHKIKGPYLAIYHNSDYRDEDLDVEVAVFSEHKLDAPISLDNGHQIIGRELEAHDLVATTIENGHHESWAGSYSALGHWLETHNYEIAAPCREVFLTEPDDENGWLVEIQFPVSKKG